MGFLNANLSCTLVFCHKSSVDHNLPDNLFASPPKSTGVRLAVFANMPETDKNAAVSATSSAEKNMAPCAASAVETASH